MFSPEFVWNKKQRAKLCFANYFSLARTKIGRQRLPDRHQHHRPHIDSPIRCDTNNFFFQNDYEAKEHFSQGAGCSPMGGNVCRAIHSRYCGGNLHFNEDVRAKKFLGFENMISDFAFFFSVCRPRQASQYAVKITHKSWSQENVCCPCFVRESSVAAVTVL